MEEFVVDESVGSVMVCFVLSGVEAGFIQSEIWVTVSTEEHNAEGGYLIDILSIEIPRMWLMPQKLLMCKKYWPNRHICV